MDGIRMFTPGSRPNRGSQASGGSPASDLGPGLQRVDSNPARLPSTTPERPEVKPIQGMMWTSGNGINSPMNFSEEPFRPGQLSRTERDMFPPKHFGRSPAPAPAQVLGIALPFSIPLPFSKSSTTLGSELKAAFLKSRPPIFHDIERTIKNFHPDLMEIIREHTPNYHLLPGHLRADVMHKALEHHPKYVSLILYHQNAVSRIPTVATAARTMTEGEQTFLTNAFRRISEDVRNRPFHIHGESAVVGDKRGGLTHFSHEPGGSVSFPIKWNDKYNIHTHPPFMEPATSAASTPDHLGAATDYIQYDRKVLSYVTNGKDVLHIQPDSTELVKLIPDPEMEDKLGKFPVAFTVPKPAQPPYPFSNHEAPGAL